MIYLSPEEKAQLEKRHRTERDSRVSDRIKAILLSSEGWSAMQISQALRIHYETVLDHLKDYTDKNKLKPENGGSRSKLNEIQAAELINHLEENTYQKVNEICYYVENRYGIKYSEPGMTDWLHTHNFSYKKPKGQPSKADVQKQQAFIEKYEEMKRTIPEDEPILFGDGVHPTMTTKITSGWIRRGQNKIIQTIASRTRVNLIGSLNLSLMKLVVTQHKTINSGAMKEHFSELRKQYPKAPKIHLILDNGPYNISSETKEAARKHDIILHHLPPYSPNINPIERVWKVMNEYERNNKFFETANEFRTAILRFFSETWDKIAHSLIDRINDNFQTFKSVTST